MTPTGTEVVLKIRCSDGRSRKPSELRGRIVHTLRHPGGVLFPDLCAHHMTKKWRMIGRLLGGVVRLVERQSLLFEIDTMVGLKKVTKIVLMSHGPCGAAEILGFDQIAIERHLLTWAKRLQRRYPHIVVEVFTETHSECGSEHFGHQRLTPPVSLVRAA